MTESKPVRSRTRYYLTVWTNEGREFTASEVEEHLVLPTAIKVKAQWMGHELVLEGIGED